MRIFLHRFSPTPEQVSGPRLNPSVLPCRTSATRPLPSQGHTALIFSSGALGRMSERGVCCTMLKYVNVGGRGGAEFHNKQIALGRYRNGMQIAALGFLFLPLVTFRSYFCLATDVNAIHQAAEKIFPALSKSFVCIFSLKERHFFCGLPPLPPRAYMKVRKLRMAGSGGSPNGYKYAQLANFFNHKMFHRKKPYSFISETG